MFHLEFLSERFGNLLGVFNLRLLAFFIDSGGRATPGILGALRVGTRFGSLLVTLAFAESYALLACCLTSWRRSLLPSGSHGGEPTLIRGS